MLSNPTLPVLFAVAQLAFVSACSSGGTSSVSGRETSGASGGASAVGVPGGGSTSALSTGGTSSTSSATATGGSAAPASTALVTGGTIGSSSTSLETGGRATLATGGRTASSGASFTGGRTSTGAPTGGQTSMLTGGVSSVAVGGATGGRTSLTGGSAAISIGGGTGGRTATSTGGTTAVSTGGTTATSTSAKFSFFVTSQEEMTRLSKSTNGFGGDLRYGMTDGLSGADKICTEIAEASLPGSGAKGWRAFLSVTQGPSGTPVNAIDRIGTGPWYDRLGHLVAANKTDLLNPRPVGANSAIVNDLPNETGSPNHSASGSQVDNHDTLTGSNSSGGIGTTTRANTCNDWTSSAGSTGKPQIGHSWPRSSTNGVSWYSDHTVPGCSAGVNTGTQNGAGTCVGCSGGYGGIYCFALVP